MKKREELANQAKHTIGYLEAKDKESFMTGVGVAISLIERDYELEINGFRNHIKNLNSIAGSYENDLKTLASIVKRYSDE